jgi:hypothetical protein
MALEPQTQSDERLTRLCDEDALWGPLISLRPAKDCSFTVLRGLLLASALGSFYGMLLNIALSLICRRTGHLPPIYGMPLVLTFTYFIGFRSALVPAWNRRARLLVRRAGYLESIARRTSDPLS